LPVQNSSGIDLLTRVAEAPRMRAVANAIGRDL
jgi:hypothetical protein